MLIIGNGRLITRSETNPYLENGAVVLDGDAVKETGTLEAMRAKYPEAEQYMAEGHFAPGSMLPKCRRRWSSPGPGRGGPPSSPCWRRPGTAWRAKPEPPSQCRGAHCAPETVEKAASAPMAGRKIV